MTIVKLIKDLSFALFLSLVGFALGLVSGLVVGQHTERRGQFEYESKMLSQELKKSGLTHIEIFMNTGDGTAMLVGQVNDQKTFDLVREIVVDNFGRRYEEVDRLQGLKIKENK